MYKCMPLKAYATFVQRVRDNKEAGMDLDTAIKEAVDYCIEHNLLAGYFAENRARVVKMMRTEYAAKIYMKSLKEEGVEEGVKKGEGRLSRLMAYLLKNGKNDEAMAATESETLRHELYEKYGIA